MFFCDCCRWVSSDDTLLGFCGVAGVGHKCLDAFLIPVGGREIGYTTIMDAFANNVRAGYARVLLANPLHERLPALLVVAMCTCNSFEVDDIRDQWTRVEKLWSENCLQLAGPLVGHASDGDGRRRSAMLQNYYRVCKELDRNFDIDWEGFDLKAQIDSHGNVNGLDDQDWIHNVKKLINPLDSSCRLLLLGDFVVRMEHIQKVLNTMPFDEHGLNLEDTYRKDRQNFKSAQTLCSRKVVNCLVKMRTEASYGPPERTEGTELYLEIVGDYVDIFASSTLNLRERVVLASKVMWFLKLWRLFIAHGDHGDDIPTVGVNFISQQCFIDIVMSCHFVVLLMKMFRDKFPSLPVPLSRTGSDVCEIFFSKVGGMAGVERSYNFGDLLRAASTLNRQAEIEGDDDGVRFPRAHKKMKTVWDLVNSTPKDVLPANLGDYTSILTDEDLIVDLKEGFSEAKKYLRVLNMAPSTNCSRERSRWFRVPWEFSEPLQKNLQHLAESVPEHGDNGEKGDALGDAVRDAQNGDVPDSVPPSADAHPTQSGEPETGPKANVEASEDVHNTAMEGPEFDAIVEQSAQRERNGVVIEVQQVLHEMQEVVQSNSEERSMNEALKKKPDAMVCIPGKENEYIWKARLVSQLNENPFLSKDRLQRVKGEGNQYYSVQE